MALKVNFSLFIKFFNSGKIGGLLLLICVAVSLIIANSGQGQNFAHFLAQNVGLKTGFLDLSYSISAWINDGLMAVFFLLVGLEIKRELLNGELSSLKKASLPVLAAVGGMIVPAFLYILFNHGEDTAAGWGIPMATDIAFALAIIAMLGKRIPPSLKIFLAALAIADDLGAILVIAVFYTAKIHWSYLLMAGIIFIVLLIFNYFKVKSLWIYGIVGLFLWYVLHHSGIHATIAGVLLAFTIPAKAANESPLEKLEHLLTAPVNFIIMPIFALANTNITFESGMITGLASPLGLGIIVGLFFGKTIGITFCSWLAVKFKLANLPTGATWKHLVGVGMLAGIGFTMSIFIALLSFQEEASITNAKFAILCASLIAGTVGFFYLKSIGKQSSKKSINRLS